MICFCVRYSCSCQDRQIILCSVIMREVYISNYDNFIGYLTRGDISKRLYPIADNASLSIGSQCFGFCNFSKNYTNSNPFFYYFQFAFYNRLLFPSFYENSSDILSGKILLFFIIGSVSFSCWETTAYAIGSSFCTISIAFYLLLHFISYLTKRQGQEITLDSRVTQE